MLYKVEKENYESLSSLVAMTECEVQVCAWRRVMKDSDDGGCTMLNMS